MGPFHCVRLERRVACSRQLTSRTLLRVLRPVLQNKKTTLRWLFYSGGNTGTRTLDPMIKSHLLYQLSYVPKTGPGKQNFTILFRGSGAILTQKKSECKKKYHFLSFYFYFLVASDAPSLDICCARFMAATLLLSSQSSIRPIILSIYFADR